MCTYCGSAMAAPPSASPAAPGAASGAAPPIAFTRYQIFVVAVLAFLQFTIILDFLILSPLGAILIRDMHVTTAQFGWVVSAYAFSAGVSGILTAGFADSFDRKKLLLVFYAGFVLGTGLCGIASTYALLLIARIITGIFGGVIGSISMAIVADLFPLEMRGRVMGIVQTAFAVSQVAGLPMGLYVCNLWDWHAPFLMIAGLAAVAGVGIASGLKPIVGHLAGARRQNPWRHLWATASRPMYLKGFAATVLLATGGFMLMPFGSTFTVNNLGVTVEQLPLVYLYTGISAMIAGPLIGRLSDRLSKYLIFCLGTVLGIIMVAINCNMGISPLWLVVLVSVLLFVAISARMISTSALISAVPDLPDRGAFMSINSAIQQCSGGIAAALAGLIVVQTPSGRLEHYDILGYVTIAAMLTTMVLLHGIHTLVAAKQAAARAVSAGGVAAAV
jgi:predicted MFS family arabinose efflux permease